MSDIAKPFNFWKTVSSHHTILWPIESEWHCTSVWKSVSSQLSLWQTESKLNIALSMKDSHITSCPMYDQQLASDILQSSKKTFSSHLVLWPTDCEWHTFHSFKSQSHCVLSSDHLTISKSVSLHIVLKGSIIMMSCPTYKHQDVSDIAYSCVRQSHNILSCDLQHVSIWQLQFFWMAVSPQLALWLTECEQHCTFFWETTSSHPVANRLWATLFKCGVITSYKYDHQDVSVKLHLFLKGG